eukprot:g7363.t1
MNQLTSTIRRRLPSPFRFFSAESRLSDLGLTLPAVGTPKGSYVQCTKSGNLLFLSGHLPATVDGDLITGKVGKDLTAEEGQKAAERVGLSILATLDNELGDLNKVKRIVKLVGFVNCVDGFEQQPF